jgi:uncharacterized protein
MNEKRRKELKIFLFELLFLYFGLLLYLFLVQRHFMYFPDVTRPVPATFGAADMKVIDVRTRDGLTISGWFKAPADKGKPVVIIFHGNAGNIAMRNFKARLFIDARYGALLAEYRGYGGNPGKPTEKGLYADAHAYLDWLEKQGFPPARVVLYGESLGTGVAVQMASEKPGYKGIILESPFSSIVSMAQKIYFFAPAWLLVRDRYDSIAKIKSIKIPLLILHGAVDTIVPYYQGKRLFDAASELKKMETFPMGGHVDLYNHGAGAKILSFLDNLKS